MAQILTVEVSKDTILMGDGNLLLNEIKSFLSSRTKPKLEDSLLTLSKHLKSNNQRKTSDRVELLKVIHNLTGRFDIKTLYLKLEDKDHLTCKATVYNNVKLLTECGILKKEYSEDSIKYELNYLKED